MLRFGHQIAPPNGRNSKTTLRDTNADHGPNVPFFCHQTQTHSCRLAAPSLGWQWQGGPSSIPRSKNTQAMHATTRQGGNNSGKAKIRAQRQF